MIYWCKSPFIAVNTEICNRFVMYDFLFRFHKEALFLLYHSVYGNHYFSITKWTLRSEQFGGRIVRKLGCNNGRWYDTNDGWPRKGRTVYSPPCPRSAVDRIRYFVQRIKFKLIKFLCYIVSIKYHRFVMESRAISKLIWIKSYCFQIRSTAFDFGQVLEVWFAKWKKLVSQLASYWVRHDWNSFARAAFFLDHPKIIQ